MSQTHFCGIDFGTTNSSVAVNQSGKILLPNIDFDQNGEPIPLLRSVIYFDPDDGKIYFGQEAINRYIDNSATGRFLRSVKSLLPSKTITSTMIFNKRYETEDLVAMLLRELKARVEKSTNSLFDTVVLGRPVIFSEDETIDRLAEERLTTAAKKAGFNNIVFQYEPIAAALAYEQQIPENEEKLVLVGDFGGGTSDFTIIRLGGSKQRRLSHDRKQDILAVGGVYIGGGVFDSVLMWESIAKYFGKNARFKAPMSSEMLPMPLSIVHNLRNWHLLPQLRNVDVRSFLREVQGQNSDSPDEVENLRNLIDQNVGIWLFQAIERAKCELTTAESAIIKFNEIGMDIRELVTRKQFETWIDGKICDLEESLMGVLERAGISEDEIDTVFLTGGTSQIPEVRKVFSCRFGEKKMATQSGLFTSVAEGLACSSYKL